MVKPPQGRGDYNYNGEYSSAYTIPNTGFSLADFLSDNQNNGALTSANVVDDVRWDRSAYIQDDWKVNPRLTVNLGLRVENQTPYFERHGAQADFYQTQGVTFDPTAGQQGQSSSAGVYVLPQKSQSTPLPAGFVSTLAKDNITLRYSSNPYLIDYQTLDWGPRVGVAYKLDERTVIRAGGGLYYGGLESVGFAPNLGLNYPFTEVVNLTNPGNLSCIYSNGCQTDGITLAGGYTNFLAAGGLANATGTPNLNGVGNNLRTPYTEQFNLSFEEALGRTISASIAYIGSLSHHTSDFPSINSSPVLTPFCNSDGPGGAPTNTPCGTGNAQNPFSDVNVTEQINDGISAYHGLQTRLEKRLSNGLSFLTTYTWSHSMTDAGTAISQGDNYSGEGGTANYYIFGSRQGFGNSASDVRNRFTFNGHYALPVVKGRRFLNDNSILSRTVGGWETSVTEQIQSGEPFNVGTANFSGVNGLSQNAIRIGSPFAGGGTPDPSLGYAAGTTCPAKVRTLQSWFNPCAFKNPLPGSAITGVISTAQQAAPFLGDRSNEIAGPGYNRTDMSLFKAIPIVKESQLLVRADIFNLFNTPAFIFTGGSDAQNGSVINPGSYRFFQNNTPNSRFFQFSANYSF